MTVRYGTGGNDNFNGGSGSDIYFGGGGNDRIGGGSGEDVLDGGAGSDRVSGDAGNDLLVYIAAENGGATDIYDGGSGTDGLALVLTRAEYMSAAVQNDIARYLQFVARETNPHNGQASNAEFRFTAFDLRVFKVEALFVTVDGVLIDPRDQAVTLAADTIAASEDGASLAVDLLANDKVPDLARGVTNTQGARGSVVVTFVLGEPGEPARAQAVYTPGASWQSLAKGQTGTDSFTYTVTDADGDVSTQTVVVTITGNNDGPVAVADVGAGSENQTLTINVLGNDKDVDAGAVLTVASAGAPAGKGMASVVGNQVQFAPGSDFDHLAAGATEVVTISYSIVDEHGAVSASTIVVTVIGTNDAPIVTSDTAAATGTVVEAGSTDSGDMIAGVPSAGGTLTASDINDGATATWSGGGDAAYGRFAITAGGAWSYALDQARADGLAEGETRVDTFVATVSDGLGGTATQLVSVTIMGTNDKPVVMSNAAAASGSVVEDGAISATGLLTAIDADIGATLTWSGGGTSRFGTFAVGASGAWTYALDDAGATQSLAAGMSSDETFVATVTDDKGASATQIVTITITGTNDAPVATADIGAALEGSGIVTGSVAANDTDADTGAVLTYASSGAVPAGLSLGADGQWTFDPSNAAYQDLRAGQTRSVAAGYTVSDGVASASSTLTIIVTGTNDAPIAAVDNASAFEGGPVITGSVATNDRDPDLGDTLTFTLTEAAPAGFALNTNGGWSFDPSRSGLAALAAGEDATLVIAYIATDGSGATSRSALTLTVSGTNDRPVVTSSTDGAVTEDGATSASGIILYTDADARGAATVSVAPNAANYLGSFTAAVAENGRVTWSFDVDNAALQFLGAGRTLTQDYQVTIDDGQGGTVMDTVTVTIVGVNDAPVEVDAESYNYTDTGDVRSGSGRLYFSDVDLGDDFTVTIEPRGTGYIGSSTVSVRTDAEGRYYVEESDVFSIAEINALPLDRLEQRYRVTVSDGEGGELVFNRVSTLESIEYFIGGAGNDDLGFYRLDRNIFVGNGGSDRLTGGELGDALYGDQGPGLPDGETNEHEGEVWGGNAFDDLLDGEGGADLLVGGGGADVFRFDRGDANGDVVADFNRGEGDSLRFVGWGAGASFTQVDANVWKVMSGDGATVEFITFSNGASIQPGDFVFV